MSNPLRKTQNRGEETRIRILEVTQQLLSDHDFYSVTLDQISKEADVAKSSLLWHFESKEALLTEAACEMFRALEQAVALDKDDNLSLNEKLQLMAGKIAEYFQSNPEPKGVLISLIFNSKIPQKIRDQIDAYWQHHVDAIVDYLSSTEKPFHEDAAHTIMDVLHGCYIHWYLHKEKESFAERLGKSFQFLRFE